ncbi:mannan-binding lectin serine protease 1-like, partial [Antedon mediterranea]|uniref:mannan-binding lectin serine protease 1-like n=1 Tax=Antedon mediterranea TaxID=105859 RepID=UPI003AF428D8
NNFTFGNSVYYECDSYYDLTLESESSRVCTTEGVWRPDEPVCEQICGEADVPPNPRPLGDRQIGRIYGGRRAVAGSWPWQALLRIRRTKWDYVESICGGVLINDQWILTAAHCLNDTTTPFGRGVLPPSSVDIFLGSNELSSQEDKEVYYPEKCVMHPKFDVNAAFDADIALIKLNQSVQFDVNAAFDADIALIKLNQSVQFDVNAAFDADIALIKLNQSVQFDVNAAFDADIALIKLNQSVQFDVNAAFDADIALIKLNQSVQFDVNAAFDADIALIKLNQSVQFDVNAAFDADIALIKLNQSVQFDVNAAFDADIALIKLNQSVQFDVNAAFDADIALIKLNQSVQFSRVIRPICLPEQSNTTDNNKANVDHADAPSMKGVVIGWGEMSVYHSTSNYLREVYVSLVSRNTCDDAFRPPVEVTENMVCAGERHGGKDACRGDSGGPLMFRNYDLAYFVHGIVSWGNGCAKPGFYGVYTRVENYVNWIKNTIQTG